MNDISNEDGRPGGEPTDVDRAVRFADHHVAAVDVVLLAPAAIVVAFGGLLGAVSLLGIALTDTAWTVLSAGFALSLGATCVEVGSRLVDYAEADDVEEWLDAPESLIVGGWALVAVAILGTLTVVRAGGDPTAVDGSLVVATLVASLLLSPVVSGPAVALVQYRRARR
jgi:predicted membrane metal-binding protein